MKKGIKIFLIIFVILAIVVLADTIQAKVFDNNPLIKIRYNRDGGNVDYIDKGILVYTYVFINGEKVTVFRWEKYAPPLEETVDLDEENKENETTYIEFTRTYNIVSNLNKTDATGENNFYVVQQFQLFEPIVIKVNKKYVLQENGNYEFTFKGNKIDGKDYTIQDIFNTFDITNIEKTDKEGIEQRQDAI